MPRCGASLVTTPVPALSESPRPLLSGPVPAPSACQHFGLLPAWWGVMGCTIGLSQDRLPIRSSKPCWWVWRGLSAGASRIWVKGRRYWEQPVTAATVGVSSVFSPTPILNTTTPHLKKRFNFYFVYMCAGAHKGQERIRSLGVVIMTGCEPPTMGAGNPTLVLWKSSTHWMISEPSLQSPKISVLTPYGYFQCRDPF